MIPPKIKLQLFDLQKPIDNIVRATGKSPCFIIRDLLRKAIGQMRIVYVKDGKKCIEYFTDIGAAEGRIKELGITADVEHWEGGLWVI